MEATGDRELVFEAQRWIRRVASSQAWAGGWRGQGSSRMDLSRKKELPRGLRTGTPFGEEGVAELGTALATGRTCEGMGGKIAENGAAEPWEEAG